MMGWHVHFKDGKYNIWSTVTDSYLMDEWTEDEDEIKLWWIQEGIERALRNAKAQIARAKEQHCSAYKPAQHSLEEI